MWTLDTTVEVTPVGAYVASLHAATKRLADLTYPGLHSEDARVKKQAEAAADAAHRLIGRLQDELHECGGLPVVPDVDEPTEPATYADASGFKWPTKEEAQKSDRIRELRHWAVDNNVHQPDCNMTRFRDVKDREPNSELRYCTCLPPEPDEPEPLPAPRYCPHICGPCGLANIYGPPSCLDTICPNRLIVKPRRTEYPPDFDGPHDGVFSVEQIAAKDAA